jgi:hypothetical protein
MQMKILITIVAALAVTTALVAVAMPATSQDTMSSTEMANLAKMMMPKAVFMTVQAGDMTDGNMTFTVPYGAKIIPMDSKEIAAVATYNMPLKGTCNVTTGSGMISMADALPAQATIDYANNSAIPVAGANAVVALQDFKMTGMSKGKGMYNFQFAKLTVYLPNGTASTVNLSKPVKMSVNIDQMKMSIEGNPSLASMMAGMLKSGATFPADKMPVKLNDILAAA